ncbi:unnamed protein product [Chrysodeixis includens]|uniref:Uncharacterized protein n=1 Tax=Chrysodeixis includens TaxID=689277 RepID=A0A9P0BXV8_CHRIL|nr:unnamed protein product [Chrysodeixis includens]
MGPKPRDPRCPSPPKRLTTDCPPPINPCTIGIPKEKRPKKEVRVKKPRGPNDDEDCEPEEEVIDCGDDEEEPSCMDVIKQQAKKAAKAASKKSAKKGGSKTITINDDDDDEDEEFDICAPSKLPTCRDTDTAPQKPC